jgi:hypothetical protein
MWLIFLIYIITGCGFAKNVNPSGEAQMIIFENVRVDRVYATLTVRGLNSDNSRQIYQYSIPPRRETHQPTYAHRVFYISNLPAMLSVTIRSQREGKIQCQGQFLIKATHFLFHHHPYVRIFNSECRIEKHTLSGNQHMIFKNR